MRTILLGLLAFSVSTALVSPAAADEKPPVKAKVLLIGKQPDHPYGSHMYLHTCRMLGECLRLNGVEPVVFDGWPKDATVLKEAKTIVMYTTPAAEFLLDAPHRDEVIRLMKDGGWGSSPSTGLRRF